MGRPRQGHRNAGIHAIGIQIFAELLNQLIFETQHVHRLLTISFWVLVVYAEYKRLYWIIQLKTPGPYCVLFP